MVRVLGHVPHVNATLVPFNVADLAESQRALASPELHFQPTNGRASRKSDKQRFAAVPGTTPIASLRFRQRAKVAGRLHSVRIQPLEDVATLEGALTDASGGRSGLSSWDDGKSRASAPARSWLRRAWSATGEASWRCSTRITTFPSPKLSQRPAPNGRGVAGGTVLTAGVGVAEA